MKPGQMVYVTHGSYSSYQVEGVFIVLKEFDEKQTEKDHYDRWQAALKEPYKSHEKFEETTGVNYCTYLMRLGYIAEIASEELHSDYEG